MSAFFFDSSAFVKRYLTEVGSAWVNTETDPNSSNVIIVTEITRVEVAAAIARRHRAPSGITRDERDTSVNLLLEHFNTEYQVVPLSDAVISRAVNLMQQYRLRGYDAVQLAAALVINEQYIATGLSPLTFVTADNDLIVAAVADGLATQNPHSHP